MEDLGQRIREKRHKRNLTLEQLSQESNLSKSFLSQIERNLAQPSVSSIKKIARCLGTSVVNLFTDGSDIQQDFDNLSPALLNGYKRQFVDDVKVVRANRRKSLTLPGSSVSYDLLTPDLNRLMEVMYLRTNPGESSGEEPLVDPPGEKFGVVLKGTLEIRVRGDLFELRAGDSIYFPAHFAHSWRGVGSEPIAVVWVLTPPGF